MRAAGLSVPGSSVPRMNRTDRLYALVEELRAVAPRPRSARQLAERYEVSMRTMSAGHHGSAGIRGAGLCGAGAARWLHDRQDPHPAAGELHRGRDGRDRGVPGPGGAHAVRCGHPQRAAQGAGHRLRGADGGGGGTAGPGAADGRAPPRAAPGGGRAVSGGVPGGTGPGEARPGGGRAGGACPGVARSGCPPGSGPPRRWGAPPPATVPLAVQEAITARHVLRITYRDRHDRETVREVEPVAFAATRAQWYLMAWCGLRGGARAFRVDRILAADDTGEPASPGPTATSTWTSRTPSSAAPTCGSDGRQSPRETPT